jgi:hypothetical protein
MDLLLHIYRQTWLNNGQDTMGAILRMADDSALPQTGVAFSEEVVHNCSVTNTFIELV